MMECKGKLYVEDTINLAPGVSINFHQYMNIDSEIVADILRQFVFNRTNVDDYACCDWLYQEQPPGIYLGDKSWKVSEDPKLVELMKTADLLDGRNSRLES